MPYVKECDRKHVRKYLTYVIKEIKTKGDLNYAICEMVGRLILREGGLSYTRVSNWIDAVHGAERELTRRLLNPYEDKKIEENGDVESFEKLLK